MEILNRTTGQASKFVSSLGDVFCVYCFFLFFSSFVNHERECLIGDSVSQLTFAVSACILQTFSCFVARKTLQ